METRSKERPACWCAPVAGASRPSRGAAIAALTSALLLCTLAAQRTQAQTYTVLYSFSGSPDGAIPQAGLITDKAGNLYGTTVRGGASNCPGGPDCGIVFKLDTSGHEAVLHTFAGPPGDGGYPHAGLIMDAVGNLYGTTFQGGDSSCGDSSGCGTVFQLDTSGHETVLYKFARSGGDGAYPSAGLVMDAAGNLYGTTQAGGTYDVGTVFKLDTSGHETVLYSFSGPPDGAHPYAGLIMDKAGNLYGTTVYGGASFNYCAPYNGCGTVFKLDTSGHETVLYRFSGPPDDGEFPWAGLLMDKAGNFYGTAAGGGSDVCRCGIVFKLDTSGDETVLHTFTGSNDGVPYAGLIMDKAGNLYGTTYFGSVFKLDPSGHETVLYGFAGSYAALLIDTVGNLYGTTFQGGDSSCGDSLGCGTVFRLTQPPALSGRIVGKTKSGTTLTATLRLSDSGSGAAQNIEINQITFRTLSGTGTVTLMSPALPFSVGNLAIGASTDVPLMLNVPGTVTKFSVTEKGTLQDAAGTTYSFALSQVIYP